MLLAGCGAVGSAQTSALPLLPPEPPVPAAVAALAGRTRPCDEPTTAGGAAPALEQAAKVEPPTQDTPVKVGYDFETDTIFLRAGTNATLSAIEQALDRPDALRELAPGE